MAAVEASQQLLTRFLQRETLRLLKPKSSFAVMASQPVASTSKLEGPALSMASKSLLRRRKLEIHELCQLATSIPWQKDGNNPFQKMRSTKPPSRMTQLTAASSSLSARSPRLRMSTLPIARHRSRGWLQSRYSTRQQKQLHSAARLVSQHAVRLHLDGEVSTTASLAQLLPSTSNTASIKKASLARLQRVARLRREASSSSSVNPSIVLRGPYRGRKIAFKGHAWERNREQRAEVRQQKLESMPARIAEFNKARATLKASGKAALPF